MTSGVRVESGRRDIRAGTPATELAGRRVLCVDDDLFLRRMSSRVLGRAGAICFTAGTHDDAMAVVACEPDLDVVILDYQMPDGDIGLLVGRICTIRPTLRLIGNSSEDRSLEFSAHGVTSFLEKPWRLDALVQAMRD